VFKQHKRLLLFIPLIALICIILIVPAHNSVHLKGGFLRLFKTPLSVFYQLNLAIMQAKNIFTSYAKYLVLEKKVEHLKFDLNSLEEVRLENVRLRKLLNLKEKKPFDFVVAEVISKEPTNWLNSLIINKGKKSGIFINQPVMNFSSLIGKVIEVGPNTSKVLLISDVNSRVVCLIQRTRMEGMLEGIGKGLCRLKYLPVEADIKLGDAVISAGVGGVYPKGLVVGNIESILVERGGIYKSCIVKPASSLSGLEEVLCIKSNSGQ